MKNVKRFDFDRESPHDKEFAEYLCFLRGFFSLVEELARQHEVEIDSFDMEIQMAIHAYRHMVANKTIPELLYKNKLNAKFLQKLADEKKVMYKEFEKAKSEGLI